MRPAENYFEPTREALLPISKIPYSPGQKSLLDLLFERAEKGSATSVQLQLGQLKLRLAELVKSSPLCNRLLTLASMWSLVGSQSTKSKLNLFFTEKSSLSKAKNLLGLFTPEFDFVIATTNPSSGFNSADVFLHEVTHALCKLLYNNACNPFEAHRDGDKFNWEKLAKEVEDLCQCGLSHHHALNYGHYHEAQKTAELVARIVPFVIQEDKTKIFMQLPLDLFESFPRMTRMFQKDISQKIDELIAFSGVYLLIPNECLQDPTRSFDFTEHHCKLLNGPISSFYPLFIEKEPIEGKIEGEIRARGIIHLNAVLWEHCEPTQREKFLVAVEKIILSKKLDPMTLILGETEADVFTGLNPSYPRGDALLLRTLNLPINVSLVEDSYAQQVHLTLELLRRKESEEALDVNSFLKLPAEILQEWMNAHAQRFIRYFSNSNQHLKLDLVFELLTRIYSQKSLLGNPQFLKLMRSEGGNRCIQRIFKLTYWQLAEYLGEEPEDFTDYDKLGLHLGELTEGIDKESLRILFLAILEDEDEEGALFWLCEKYKTELSEFISKLSQAEVYEYANTQSLSTLLDRKLIPASEGVIFMLFMLSLEAGDTYHTNKLIENHTDMIKKIIPRIIKISYQKGHVIGCVLLTLANSSLREALFEFFKNNQALRMISRLETMNTRVWNSYTDEAIRILKEAGVSDFSAAEKEGKPRVKIAEKREREESGSGSNDVSDKTELKKINPEKNERDPNPFALFTNPPGPGISNSNQQEIDRLGSDGMEI